MNLPRYLFLVLAVMCLPLRAADPSEQFLSAYQSFQQAEKLERSGSNQDALTKYRFVESLLAEIAKSDPGWQKPVVDYRLKKTREAIDRLQGDISTPAVVPVDSPTPSTDSVTPAPPARRGPSITIVPPSGTSPSDTPAPSSSGSGNERLLRKRISDLTEELGQVRDALSSQKTRESDLESARWVSERSKLENELSVAKRTIDDLRHDLKARASWEKDLKDLQRRLDDAVADKLAAEEQFHAEAMKAGAEKEDLVRELTKAREGSRRGEELGVKYADLSTQADALRQEVGKLKASLEEAVGTARESEARKAELEKQLEKATSSVAVAARQQEELAPLREKIAIMERAEKSLHRELDAAHAAVAASVGRETSLKDRLKSADEERKKLSDRLQSLAEVTASAAKVKPEAAVLGRDITSLRSELKAAEETASKAMASAEEFAAKAGELSASHDHDASVMSADLSVLEEEEAALKAKSTDRDLSAKLSPKLDQIGGEIARLKERLAKERITHASRRAELNAGMERNEAMLKDLQARAASARDRLTDDMTKLSTLLTGDTEGLKSAVNGLRQQLEESTVVARESRKRIERIQSESARRGDLLGEREKELASSREEAKRLRDDLDITNRKLTELRDKQKKGEDRFHQLEQQLASLGNGAKPSGDSQETSLKDLQSKLEEKEAQVARLRRKGGVRAELEKSSEENQLLRGIVERQIRDEARREQSRRLVEEELARLNVKSLTLSDQLGALATPPVLLTPAEKSLFKGASPSLPPEGDAPKIKESVSAPMPRPTASPEVSTAPPSSAPPGADVPAKSGGNGRGNLSSNSDVTTPQDQDSAATNPPSPNAGKVEAAKSTNPPAEMPWEGKFKEYLAMAKNQFEAQRYQEAETTFKKALELSPDDYFALSNLGVVEFQLGRLKDAEEVLRRASNQSSESSFALTTLGIVHYRQDRLDDAAKVLSRAVTVNDQDYTAHNYLGIVMAASGKGKAGESEIMRAIEINPKYADAHFNLAVIYATGKPPAKMMAKKHYAKAIELGSPPDPSLEKLIQ